jgi:tellurite resistance protein TehA-like permease
MKPKSNKLVFGLCVLGVGAFHFFLSFVLLFVGGIMKVRAAQIAGDILIFPLSLLKAGPNDSYNSFESLMQLAAWGLLSLFWGFVICTLFRMLVEKGKA